ncbi:ankyrin-repeat-containing protein [Parathielavia appendiculata]|uniref:Ankyrin-repeat-containing protein n=1 Tax=Parathielavia appendiculata TaxID=2587402 RepID=A0AAN6TXT8_9PEZI|nr:ankyrin-repeat-containing protein [Parathielavia appendiculata]
MTPQLREDEIDDLLYAARTGDNDELTSLLSSLAERENASPAEILITAKDEGKSTCLHMATGNGHTETVALLISHFASRPKEEEQAFLDAPNEYGNTGLHWAALGGHLPVVTLLVEHGASVALANDKNYVPLDLASFGDKFDVVDYFLAQSGGLEEENALGVKQEEGEGLNGAVEGVQIDEKGEEEEEACDEKGKGKKKEKQNEGCSS